MKNFSKGRITITKPCHALTHTTAHTSESPKTWPDSGEKCVLLVFYGTFWKEPTPFGGDFGFKGCRGINTHTHTLHKQHTPHTPHTHHTHKHTQTHTTHTTHTNTQTHKHTNTQTHKHTNTQTHKHTYTILPQITNTLGTNAGGTKLNQYTLIMDIMLSKLPTHDEESTHPTQHTSDTSELLTRVAYQAIFQTDHHNTSEADVYIRHDGAIGAKLANGYSKFGRDRLV